MTDPRIVALAGGADERRQTSATPDDLDALRSRARPSTVALATIQWVWGGLFDGRPALGFDICLVRSTGSGTPGMTLCGRDRFAPDAPGWSVNGGIYGPNVHNEPCAGCVEVRDRDYPDLRVTSSLFGGLFAPVGKGSS